MLKRIDRVEIRTNNEELKAICAFLEMIMDSKFVKIHGDFQLEDISLYLVELFRHCSRQIYNIEMDGTNSFFISFFLLIKKFN